MLPSSKTAYSSTSPLDTLKHWHSTLVLLFCFKILIQTLLVTWSSAGRFIARSDTSTAPLQAPPSSVFAYHFTYTSPYSPAAIHSAELPFVFGNLGSNPIFGPAEGLLTSRTWPSVIHSVAIGRILQRRETLTVLECRPGLCTPAAELISWNWVTQSHHTALMPLVSSSSCHSKAMVFCQQTG